MIDIVYRLRIYVEYKVFTRGILKLINRQVFNSKVTYVFILCKIHKYKNNVRITKINKSNFLNNFITLDWHVESAQ